MFCGETISVERRSQREDDLRGRTISEGGRSQREDDLRGREHRPRWRDVLELQTRSLQAHEFLHDASIATQFFC